MHLQHAIKYRLVPQQTDVDDTLRLTSIRQRLIDLFDDPTLKPFEKRALFEELVLRSDSFKPKSERINIKPPEVSLEEHLPVKTVREIETQTERPDANQVRERMRRAVVKAVNLRHALQGIETAHEMSDTEEPRYVSTQESTSREVSEEPASTQASISGESLASTQMATPRRRRIPKTSRKTRARTNHLPSKIDRFVSYNRFKKVVRPKRQTGSGRVLVYRWQL